MYAARNKNSVLTSWAVGNALSFSFENTSVSLIVTSKEAEIKVMQYVRYLLIISEGSIFCKELYIMSTFNFNNSNCLVPK